VKNTFDAELGAAPHDGFLEKILSSQRRRLFDAFMQFKHEQGGEGDSILDVEARSPLLQENASYLLAWSDARQRSRIVSCAIEPAGACVRRTHEEHPASHASIDDRQKYQRADGRYLPYADDEFDWVFCSEIIEHAGSDERQYALLKELARVARKGIFVTTANRWHPLEFHTALPLLHWLPAPAWRGVLRFCGKGRWAPEAALNLQDAKGLHRLAGRLPGSPKCEVGHVRLGGIKAHFFLQIRKTPVIAEQKKAA